MDGLLLLMTRLFDPLAFALVALGAPLVAALRAPAAAGRGFAALSQLWKARPEADAQAATLAAGRLEALAHIRDIACADRLETAGRFVRLALRRLADATTAEAFVAWAEDELAGRARRHARAIGFWRGVADAAPAMGMIGTVLGLIRMFAGMDDAAAIGPAMATALLATLYGLALANIVAAPIADRLEALSEEECAWQRRLLDRFAIVARTELSRPTRLRAA